MRVLGWEAGASVIRLTRTQRVGIRISASLFFEFKSLFSVAEFNQVLQDEHAACILDDYCICILARSFLSFWVFKSHLFEISPFSATKSEQVLPNKEAPFVSGRRQS